MVYLQKILNMKQQKNIKVIHVHFLHGRKNFYFGSISAIFKKFTEKELGCTESYLLHVLTDDGSSHITSEACFIRSHLIKSERE